MGRSVFSKQGLLVFSLLATAVLLWAGDKSWNRPYQSWDTKDIQQIMTDSPWVADTMIQINWHPILAQKDVPPQQIIGGGVRTSPGTVGGGGAGTNPEATNRSGDASQTQQKVVFYWASSKLMRVASARRSVLNGSMTDSDVQKYATTVNSEYAVAMAMQDMTPFAGKDPKDFQNDCFLVGKRSKVKVLPSRAEYQKSGDRIMDVVFFFPKTAPSGQPTIASDETDVVFSVRVAGQTLHADFKPKKMVDQFGTDL
jgi:hypothetical protein